MKLTQLAEQMALHGGAIVRADECDSMELEIANLHGRVAVDDHGIQFVRRPKEWLETVKQREAAALNA